MGVVTGKGLLALVRERYGAARRDARARRPGGREPRHDLRRVRRRRGRNGAARRVSRYVSVPLAALGVSLLVLRGTFHRVEHVLLALSAVFVAYIVSGFLAHPDWGGDRRGLVVPSMPLTREAVLVAVATRRDDAGAVGPRVHPVLRGRQAARRSRTCATSAST